MTKISIENRTLKVKKSPKIDRLAIQVATRADEAVLRGLNGSKSEAEASIERYMAAIHAPNTVRAYSSDMTHFFGAGYTIPAKAEQIIQYLARFAGTLSVATLTRRLTAIHRAHIENSLPSPVLDYEVKRMMQGVRRSIGVKQRQVKPLVRDDLLEALLLIERQKPMKAARDRAMLMIGWASAMRSSELVNVRVEHLTFLNNGLEIYLPISKTDQQREGRTVFCPYANSEQRCPVLALKRWLVVSEISEGFVFRSVTRHDYVGQSGLSAQSVALVVKASVARAGGDAEKVASHSLRAGYCTSAAEAGLASWQIRQQTGHKSEFTLSKYIRPVTHRKIPSLL